MAFECDILKGLQALTNDIVRLLSTTNSLEHACCSSKPLMRLLAHGAKLG